MKERRDGRNTVEEWRWGCKVEGKLEGGGRGGGELGGGGG